MQERRGIGISRVQVDEGFLDGLDLQLHPALNVIIGSRGSGKTSIIELIRYCLDVPPIVQRPVGVASRQALQVLGQGRVTVTVTENDETIVVSRQAGEVPRGIDGAVRPVIVGTSEIERIGVEPLGRIALIDSFLDPSDAVKVPLGLHAEITSQIELLNDLRQEVDGISSSMPSEVELDQTLESLVAEQHILQAKAPELDSDRLELQKLSLELAAIEDEKRELEQLEDFIRRDGELFRSIVGLPPVESPNPRFQRVVNNLRKVHTDASESLTLLENSYRSLQAERAVIDRSMSDIAITARPLRQRLNEHVSGLGTISSRVDQLRQQKQTIHASRTRIEKLRGSINHITHELEENLDKLDSAAAYRFACREAVIVRLNAQLGPRIKISIVRSGAFAPYEAEIVALMRGSGVHRTTVALLAKRLSPRELYRYISSGDVDGLCHAAEIPVDRGLRVIEGLQASEYWRLLFTDVEDEVTFWLLVGPDYQPTDYLSTGQRCTAVLPVLLAQPKVALILDQPEDHLDNAFIVETLVEGIRRRKLSGQVIVASHNANVPVLADAEEVILMRSDGQHGYVHLVGELDEPRIVSAILDVLEGGAAAFARRAEFYKAHAPERT